MARPRHAEPTKSAACAPYNFIPLPKRVMVVTEGIDQGNERVKPWEHHDEYIPGTHTGWIDLNIETCSPLYIRNSLKQRAGKWDKPKSAAHYECYQLPSGDYAIPGSSLRGTVRSMIEILSFAKFTPVSNDEPFYRDMKRDVYRERFTTCYSQVDSGIDYATGQTCQLKLNCYESRVRGGFLGCRNGIWFVEECDVARVDHNCPGFPGDPYVKERKTWYPNPDYQHARVWAKADDAPNDYFFKEKKKRDGGLRHGDLYLRFRKVHELATDPQEGFSEGTLVISGWMMHKHLEFVFLRPPKSTQIRLEFHTLDRFHDDDQLTQWQEKTFDRQNDRLYVRKEGALSAGDPIFFLTKTDSETGEEVVDFLGRAQNFRYPYELSVRDLLPEEHGCTKSLDLAEVLFGRIDRDGSHAVPALKGRLTFEDATISSDEVEVYDETRAILSSPKPTCYPHYLDQRNRGEKGRLRSYLAADKGKTTLRGYKWYWNRWDPDGTYDQIDSLKPAGNENEKNSTRFRPITTKQECSFTGRIRFYNLTDLELGALWTALELPANMPHRIGMAKPLGLGAVRITPSLSLLNLDARYGAWKRSDLLSDTDTSDILTRSKEVFATTTTMHAKDSREPMTNDGNSGTVYDRVGRLNALRLMLAWEIAHRPEHSYRTDYMDLEDFKNEQVLPPPYSLKNNAKEPKPLPDETPAGTASAGASKKKGKKSKKGKRH